MRTIILYISINNILNNHYTLYYINGQETMWSFFIQAQVKNILEEKMIIELVE